MRHWFASLPINLFGLWAAVTLVAYSGIVRLHRLNGTLAEDVTPQTIRWYLLAFVAYLGAVTWVERRGQWPRQWAWATAILSRLLLLFTTPTLSDDVYRYLWDGYVAHNGVSPYALAINDPALDYLEIPQRALANNAWMATPYLPVAQVVFWLVTFVSLAPFAMQLAMVIFDLLAAAVLAWLLPLANLPPRRLLLYLWNPLVVLEVAHGAHVDTWMILLTLAAVYFTLRPFTIHNSQFIIHDFLPPLFLSLATLTKVVPVLALPVLFWRWSWRQRFFYAAATIALLVPAGLRAGWGVSGELDGRGLFGALRIYTHYWNFNSGLFHWLEVWLGAPGYGPPLPLARNLVLVLLAAVLLAVWLLARRHQSDRAMLRLMAVPFMAYVILSPTVHPWYILIVLAFLPFLPPAAGERSWGWPVVSPWLYLSGALIFSYLTYLNPHNLAELEWVRQLEWIPTLLMLVAGGIAVPYLYRH